MEVTFLNPGFDEILASIMEFQAEGENSFWSEPLYHFYPQLDRAYAESLPAPKRKKYIADTMWAVYQELEEILEEKAALYTKRWEKYKGQITGALSEAFETDCRDILNDLRAHVTLNPVCPRYLAERQFDIFYLNSDKGAIGLAIHEIIHFVWFIVWQRVFGDEPAEYERPHLKWILSEMAVEPVMRDERLCTINPYFPRENGGCVYPYFYDMVLDGKPVLDTLDGMFRRRESIEGFMKESYRYCQEHEAEIRRHIEAAEEHF